MGKGLQIRKVAKDRMHKGSGRLPLVIKPEKFQNGKDRAPERWVMLLGFLQQETVGDLHSSLLQQKDARGFL